MASENSMIRQGSFVSPFELAAAQPIATYPADFGGPGVAVFAGDPGDLHEHRLEARRRGISLGDLLREKSR